MNNLLLTQQAGAFFDSGAFARTLAQRVAFATESPNPERGSVLDDYLQQQIIPELTAMGFHTEVIANSVRENCPFMIAERIEDANLPTLLCYGHGDVVFGDAANWREGLNPWRLVIEGDRWYGRGTADNKGQHSINFAALQQVFKARNGRLGFNCKILFEMGEEIGSPGLAEICQQNKQRLAADLFIASDGPRLSASQPTLFLGSRGCINFSLTINARKQSYHSGNWGGLLSNPGTQLANAIASLVNQRGEILIAGLRPPAISDDIRQILSQIKLSPQADDPTLATNWGEPGLSATERLFGWNSLEVLTYKTGNPEQPVNAIPPSAKAICQLRFVVGTDWQNIQQHLRQHLDQSGFNYIDIEILNTSPATRFNPTDPLVNWALDIMQQSSGKQPALLPNLGGSLPNDVFADILGLPTLWIPHSYPACGQHGVNEHLLQSIAREGLLIMTQLFWQLGEPEFRKIYTR